MAHYTNLELKFNHLSSSVYLLDTDPDIIDWIIEQVRDLPGASKCKTADEKRDFSGRVYSCRLVKLGGQDEKIGQWIFQLLLRDEWEPYGAMNDGSGKSTYFRKVIG